MQVNANSIVILNTLFVLDFLHDKDLDLDFILSVYDIKAIKHKAYLTFSLQPKRNINVFAGLSTNDKSRRLQMSLCYWWELAFPHYRFQTIS